MKFLCEYINLSGEKYHRTVYADTIGEAVKQAEKWVNTGYFLSTVKREL